MRQDARQLKKKGMRRGREGDLVRRRAGMCACVMGLNRIMMLCGHGIDLYVRSTRLALTHQDGKWMPSTRFNVVRPSVKS